MCKGGGTEQEQNQIRDAEPERLHAVDRAIDRKRGRNERPVEAVGANQQRPDIVPGPHVVGTHPHHIVLDESFADARSVDRDQHRQQNGGGERRWLHAAEDRMSSALVAN
jgi:hypothetical protein